MLLAACMQRLLLKRRCVVLQVHKLCANHYITADMSLAPMARGKNAVTWHAQDFSDGELKVCLFF